MAYSSAYGGVGFSGEFLNRSTLKPLANRPSNVQSISGSGPRGLASLVVRISQGGKILFKSRPVLLPVGSLLPTVLAFTQAHVARRRVP